MKTLLIAHKKGAMEKYVFPGKVKERETENQSRIAAPQLGFSPDILSIVDWKLGCVNILICNVIGIMKGMYTSDLGADHDTFCQLSP